MDILQRTSTTAKQFSELMHDIKVSDSDGIYIVDTGRAQIINPYDQHCFGTVQRGDFFGESTFLKCPVSNNFININKQSFNYFGDIISEETVDRDFTCFFISV